VCVCVCVCEGGREREREKAMWTVLQSVYLNEGKTKAYFSSAAWWAIEWKNTTSKDTSNPVGRFPLCQLQILLYQLQNCFHVEEAGFLGCCALWLTNSFPTLQKNVPPLLTGLWSPNLAHNHDKEGDIFFRNCGKKLPNHATQQSRRHGPSTVTQWIPKITAFVLLRMYLLLHLPYLLGLVDIWLIFYERMKRCIFL
jgi:hypothetical protein